MSRHAAQMPAVSQAAHGGLRCAVVRGACAAALLLGARSAVAGPPPAPPAHGAPTIRMCSSACEGAACVDIETARRRPFALGRRASSDGADLPPGPAAWLASGQFFNDRGRRIFFRREGHGPTLLVLHGFPTSSYDFAEIWPALTARFDVIAVDLLGSGFSDKPFPYDYSVFEQADILERLTNALGVTRAHVLAHDYGGTVAQELLARSNAGASPLCLQSATFLNGGLFVDAQNLTPVHYLLDSPAGVPVGVLTCKPVFKCITNSFTGDAAQNGVVDLDDWWAILNYNRGKRVMHGIIQYLDERKRYAERWTAALACAPCPLAYVYGAEDGVSGDSIARRFAAVVPDAPVVRMCDLDHYPHVEAAGRTAAVFHALHDRYGTPPAGAAPSADRGTIPPPPAPR